MATVQDPHIQPGVDSKVYDKTLTADIASELSDALGAPIGANQVTPAFSQKVVTEDPEKIIEEPDPPVDVEDIIAGIQGKPRTEASRNFLKKLLVRLKKMHPGGKIEITT